MGSQFGGIPVDQPQAAQSAPSDSQFGGIPAAPPDFSTTVYAPKDEGFFTTLAKDIYNAPKNLMEAVSVHPIDALTNTGTALTEGRHQSWQQTKDAYAKGNYKEAFEHLVGAFPVLGPPLNAAMNEMRMPESGQQPDETHQGLSGQGMAHAVENLAPFAVPALEEATATETGQRAIQAVQSRIPSLPESIVKSRLNPVQQNAVDFLQSRDVPLNVGTATGNRFAKGAQALVAQTPLGSGVAAGATQATEQGLARVAGDLAEQAHPEPATPESAGAAVTAKLEQNIAGLKAREDEAYGDAWKGANDPQYGEVVPVRTEQKPMLDAKGKSTGTMQNVPVMQSVQMPVDVRDIKTQLGPVMEQMSWMPAADQSSSAGYQAVKKILQGPDFIPAQAAEQGLGGLKTMARVANPNLRNTGQGLAAGIIPRLQEAVNDAVAKTGSDAVAGLQDGRAAHASKMEVADIADQLRDEPVQTFNKLTWQKDTGISFLRKIADQAPDVLPQVGRAYLQNLFDVATQEGGFSRAAGIAKQWENLGPQTKKLLFPNRQLQSSLDNFFRGAKMAAENPNPSGTALVSQVGKVLDWGSAGAAGAGLWLHNPMVLGGAAAYQLSSAAIAKLLYSPAGVRLLTGGLKAESPAAAAFRASQILKMVGRTGAVPISRQLATPNQPQ